MMNLKPEDLVKALRSCSDLPTGNSGCAGCMFASLFEPACTDLLLRHAADQIERDQKEIAELRETQRWIPVAERLPAPETDVLAVCNRNGYIFVTPAIYEDGKMLTQDSAWDWNDIYCYGLYDEEADDYYIPEGWWENRQFNPDDVYNNPVDCAVTHWMPLPEAPEEDV